jgi:uncharacterized protein (DUF2147 family)
LRRRIGLGFTLQGRRHRGGEIELHGERPGMIRQSGSLFKPTAIFLLLITSHSRPALSEVPLGTWMFANRVAIQVFDCRGLLCGRIVWLRRPRTPTGQPDLDNRNPNPSLRQRHLCGLTIIWGMRPSGPAHWTGGWLYDPQNGTTYHLTAEQTSPTTISARVYHGSPLLGRTEILTRDPQLTFDGRC